MSIESHTVTEDGGVIVSKRRGDLGFIDTSTGRWMFTDEDGNTRELNVMQGMYRDWWVDGHYIASASEEEARAEVLALYGHRAEEVRAWVASEDGDKT